MTDRELLELAAKAAGIAVDWRNSVSCLCYSGSPYNVAWNPLTDDGDALRLAVKLRIDLEWRTDGRVSAFHVPFYAIESSREDAGTATRRAIVRAAAEIGRAMS